MTVNVANTSVVPERSACNGPRPSDESRLPARRTDARHRTAGQDQGPQRTVYGRERDAVPSLANVGNDGYAGLQQGIFSLLSTPVLRRTTITTSFTRSGRQTVTGCRVHCQHQFDRYRSRRRNWSSTRIPQDAHAEHHGGAVMMGNDGKIYFTTGEHFDASDAQRLTNPRGKVHRINPDGSVPTDNPFYDGAGPNVDSIWAYGLRNPYRAYYDQPTGRMYIGDVGGNDAATAKEELDLGQAGANFGWPNSEGTCGGACNPLYFYAHQGRDASITAGFVYHGSQYPSSYQGSFFFADYAQNWIKRLTFDANGRVNGVFNFEPSDGSADGPYGDIVFLTEGPDGALYYIDLGYSDISGTFGVSKIRRIRYLSNNLAPTAVISATPTGGAAPLAVDFSSAGSVDPEGQPLTFSWTFGDGATSASANPSHTYAADGPYVARLTVSDGVNASVSTSLKISVGAVPTATILTPTDQGRFIAGDIISFTGDGIDALDGALPASAYSWTIDFLHGGHVHPGATQTGVKSGSFTIPTTGHDFSGDTRYRVTLTVVNSAGLSASTSVTIYPVKVNLSFATSPPGLTIYVDGIAKTTPFVHDSVPGFVSSIQAPDQATGNTNYRFASWSDGGAQTHNLVAPTTDQSYTATFTQAVVTSPPAFVQVNSVTPQTDQSAVTVTFLSAQTAGSTNVIAIGWNSAAGNVNSVTDSAGNLYQSATVLARGTGLSQTIWYAKNIVAAPAGSNTVTVTLSAAMPYVDVRALEYRGLDPADPVDRTTAASGSSLAANSGPVTTTFANTLIFGAGMTLGTFNAATGGATTRIITQPDADIAQDQIVSATGTYSATANLGSATNWLMQLVAFKAATTSPPPPDTTAPTQPTGLNATPSSASQIGLSWTASTDNVAVTGYNVFRNGVQVGTTTTATTYVDGGLTANTTYSYTIAAVDATGNTSTNSTATTATTTQVTSPPAFVQVNSVTPQTDQSAVTVTFLSAQTAGSTNVIAIGWNSAAGNVNSVTDSAGNLYQSATVLARGTGLSQTIWYAKNIVAAPAGSNTVTVTLSAAMPYVDVRALEYRGLDPADPVDRTTAASGSSLAANSGPVTTTFANTLIFGAGMTLGTFNAATGGATTRIITQPDADIAQDQIVSATGTYSATANLGSATNWVMQLVAFKAATTSPPSQ